MHLTLLSPWKNKLLWGDWQRHDLVPCCSLSRFSGACLIPHLPSPWALPKSLRKKSINSDVMTAKHTEPPWIWKSREQVTTTFHQFSLSSFNTLHFLQVGAFLLRTLVPGPLVHHSQDLAAGTQGHLSPSAAVASPVLSGNEQRQLVSTLISV